MTAENFVYWLQGFFEIDGAEKDPREGLSKAQVDMIKKHLEYVFNKPEVPNGTPISSGPATGTATFKYFDSPISTIKIC